MKTIFSIDTSNNKEVKVRLTIEGKEYPIEQAIDYRKAQVVLPLLEDLLKKHNLSLRDLTGIEVNPGPGSFTGVRVGVAIANALSFLLKVPVNGKAVGEMVEPVYS